MGFSFHSKLLAEEPNLSQIASTTRDQEIPIVAFGLCKLGRGWYGDGAREEEKRELEL